jgi:hypothetical protein
VDVQKTDAAAFVDKPTVAVEGSEGCDEFQDSSFATVQV